MFRFAVLLAVIAPLALSGMPLPARAPALGDSIMWHAVADWGVEGRGWTDVTRFFDRLPARAEQSVRPKVWELSRHSAGMSCRFATDAPEIRVRYSLLHSRLAMPHMPATGVSGVDLYALLDDGRWNWVGTVQPTEQRVAASIVKGLGSARRTYILYLPLYNGIDSLEIGIPTGSSFEPIPPRRERPVVFYGTSIMHGACASRPGMAITGILGRRLNVPVVNLGFSGNGKMEIEVARLLSELDARVFVIDCLPNLTPAETAERTEPFVRFLRGARPSTPILLVEDRIYANALLLPERLEGHRERQRALRETFERLIGSGMQGLYYLEGSGLLGSDGEATVDGSHPTDLGMMRYADAYEKALRPLLGGE